MLAPLWGVPPRPITPRPPMTPPIEPMTLTDWVMLIVVFLIVAAVLSELADRHRRR